METIKGFTAASSRLSRRAVSETDEVTPRTLARLKEIFGRDIRLEEAVACILDDVRRQGDQAVLDYIFKIDGFNLDSLEVNPDLIKKAYSQTNQRLIEALTFAAERIRSFHEAQKSHLFQGVEGDDSGQLVRPLSIVGVYAPGGTASYPSTVLMTAIPARVAGVREVILATPPRSNGAIPPATLVAADIAGVDRIFSMGGAQAIAAMAYGTTSVPAVDKICGPGNIFVALAKKMVFGAVDIDGIMGPSEVLIIADDSTTARYCAADLLAQAEHDPLAQVVLATTSRKLAAEVEKELKAQVADLPRSGIAEESLEKRGVIALVGSIEQAIQLANLYAPEHLELLVKDAEKYIDNIQNAGCIFVGEYSPVPIGDYVAGPNHSLPTGGTARFSSPLNVADFIKFIDVVRINPADFKRLGSHAITLARAEGLEAHARAIEKRLKDL